MSLREDADRIICAAITAARPENAVVRALEKTAFGNGRLVLIAAGKAAWQMADAAASYLGDAITSGVVITKYGHSRGPIGGLKIFEAGHPVPDEHSFSATAAALDAVKGLTEQDDVLFLLSGGGSALFEYPLIEKEELLRITQDLLACGADIVEMNMIRKRLSAVKGGRFAKACAPAHVTAVVLSDILGDPLDMIASGPVCEDTSGCGQALAVVRKYGIAVSDEADRLLHTETEKKLENVTTYITGSVRQLCTSAEATCRSLGYEPVLLTTELSCTARDAGVFLASVGKEYSKKGKYAFLAGGETVVKLTGTGMGGRNQELALAAAPVIAGLENVAVFSVGSDGTDGPTDAAGGYVDGHTIETLKKQGIDVFHVLRENDSYHALQSCGGLIVTGPTGTNVNDLSVVLIDGYSVTENNPERKERSVWGCDKN